jgi:uroporphyrinogen-III decarboxylase
MNSLDEQQSFGSPLEAAERADLRRRFDERLARTEPRMAEVFAFKPMARPVSSVTDASYWTFGRALETVPDTYFTDPAAMTSAQERWYLDHLRSVDDDFVPYLMPWFGTVVTASAFGCRIDFRAGQEPAVDPTYYPVQGPDDIRRLRVPDPQRDGLMPRVLECLRYMKENSDLPVGITDFQGPLTTANQLMGYDKLIYLMMDDPPAMHQLMDTVTDGLITWFQAQKELIGEGPGYCIGNQIVYTGPNIGIWLSDDDAVLIDADLYREFVVPYNSRILTAFGGGIVHYCGNGSHHADNFLATDGLKGLNVFTLHDFAALAELHERVKDRLVLFIADFTPVDYRAYLERMAEVIELRGVAFLSVYSPILGLLPDGRYDAIPDRRQDSPREFHEYLLDVYDRS